ncbi:MAG TPA: efflux transporter outer membrane subunit [Thermoanaerobaculia bacterium]|nr:efflux transporter outer membrane subunit [Thermoanaerobaculia bacterium]
MKRAILVLLTTTVLAGCKTVGPNYQRPPVAIPDQFYGANGAASSASLADAPWFDVFGDPTLRSLIDEALRNGYDARIAAARIDEARARFGIVAAERYPAVGYEIFPTHQHVAGQGSTVLIAGVGISSWEVDLWGRVRRSNEAGLALYLSSEEGHRAALLALTSEVATAYFDLRELDAELDIARRSTKAFQETYDLFNRQLQGGTASAVETSRAEALLANEAAEIPSLELQIVEQENRINFLLGRPPGPIARGVALTDLPTPPAVPAGLPSALLLRRPDLRAAEQQLIAANANIGVAEAAFYPTLTLTAVAGGQSTDLANFIDHGPAWSIAAELLGPIFAAGRLRDQRRVAVAQFEQARLLYEQDVMNALGEVSTAIVAMDRLAEAEHERTRALHANQEAVRLVNLRYASGLSAYFEVLDAMEQLLTVENNVARTRRDRLVELVQFYRALGGGWQAEAATTTETKPAAPAK